MGEEGKREMLKATREEMREGELRRIKKEIREIAEE